MVVATTLYNAKTDLTIFVVECYNSKPVKGRLGWLCKFEKEVDRNGKKNVNGWFSSGFCSLVSGFFRFRRAHDD